VTERTDRMRRRRAQLFGQQDGLCFWCEEPMELLVVPVKGRQPPKSCTIDHLRDRFDPARRQKCRPGEQRLVAACWECNNRRGSNRQASISLKTLQRRAGSYPRREAAE
jgi:hypothetical protein